VGRGSWVANDLQDQRPAVLIDFENNRLVIYYCTGDGKTVDAKFLLVLLINKRHRTFPLHKSL
jgi:hypothetical protein